MDFQNELQCCQRLKDSISFNMPLCLINTHDLFFVQLSEITNAKDRSHHQIIWFVDSILWNHIFRTDCSNSQCQYKSLIDITKYQKHAPLLLSNLKTYTKHVVVNIITFCPSFYPVPIYLKLNSAVQSLHLGRRCDGVMDLLQSYMGR